MASITHRMLPPANGATTKVNGRTYTCAAGSYLDVPDFDASELMANGWTTAAVDGSGPTASRPTNPKKGAQYHDTTLGYNVVHDGKVWRNPTSGVAA